MRAAVAVPLIAVLVWCAACGSAGQPDSARTSSSGLSEPTLVGLYSGTAAGGTHLGSLAIDVGTEEGRRTVLDDLRAPLAQTVADAIDAVVVPEGQRLYAGVVAIGCGTPVDAKIVAHDDGVRFDPVYDRKPPMECFAAVTTIALALVPEDWTGAAPAP